MKQLAIIAIITVAILVPLQAFASSYDETTKHSAKMFGIVSGDYNNKNGLLNLSGMYKYGNTNLSDIRIVGVLKSWNYWDSSIPNCKHAFSDDMIVMFDKNQSYGKIVLVGKWCEANWNGNWKTLRADYIIIDGKVPYATGIDGKGVLEVLINIQTGQVLSGKINGNLNIYT